MKGFSVFLFLSLLSLAGLHAQFGNFPLNRDYNALTNAGLSDKQYNFHSSIAPYNAEKIDSLDIHLMSLDLEFKSNLLQQLFNADTAKATKGLLEINAQPVVNLIYATGQSNDSSDTGYNLGLGIRLNGFVGKKVTFGFEYTYSRNQYADYVDQFINERGVIPGMGRGQIRGDYYENRFYAGYLSYDPVDFLNIQAGVGKHFYGNGYRSLLLSDNSFVYPYLRLSLDIWKFNYQVLYSFHENLDYQFPYDANRFSRKYSTTNFLSMNVGKRLNFGLFQTVIWYDEEDTKRGFDVNYMNPVVFMRPIEFSIGSPDNVLIGLDARYRFYKNYSVYAQVILDEFLLNEIRADSGWWGNKYGYQIGIKAHDAFDVKGLGILLEHNWVRPFTYSHSNPQQNYGHYNEALAHTLGSNFYDFIGRATYTKKRWLLTLHTVFAVKGNDFLSPNTNFGGDIFRSNNDQRMEYNNVTGQGLSTRKQYAQIKLGYLISPDAAWMFEVGMSARNNTFVASEYSPEFTERNWMFHFGIKTALHNQYLDF